MNVPRARPPAPQIPLVPALCRATVDWLRAARRTWRGAPVTPAARPEVREIVSLWLVQRLPDRWHRFLAPRDGDAPVQFVLPPRRGK